MKSLSEGISAGSATLLTGPNKALAAKAREFMTRGVTTLRSSQTLSEAIQLLLEKKLSGAPVLGADGKLVGMLSEFDCMKAIVESSFHHDDRPGSNSVAELMSTDIWTVRPDTDAYTIAHLLITHGIRRVPVVDDGQVVGLVSRRDVLLAIRALVD
jgi:CBS domain-containing protein